MLLRDPGVGCTGVQEHTPPQLPQEGHIPVLSQQIAGEAVLGWRQQLHMNTAHRVRRCVRAVFGKIIRESGQNSPLSPISVGLQHCFPYQNLTDEKPPEFTYL